MLRGEKMESHKSLIKIKKRQKGGGKKKENKAQRQLVEKSLW